MNIPAPFTVTFERIDAKRAAELLSTNTPHNRNVSNAQVLRYARDMANHAWPTTHQGIAVGTDGHVYDGQHRLLAVIAADKQRPGTAISAMVCYGINPDTFKFIDAGRARNVSSFLEGPYKTARAAMARTVMSIDRAGGRYTPTLGRFKAAYNTHEVLDFLSCNPDLARYGDEYAKDATRLAAAFKGTQTGALLTGGYYAGMLDNNKWDSWWRDATAVANGDGLPTGNPVKALYRCPVLTGTSTSATAYARAIYAGSKVLKGESLRLIRSDAIRGFQVW